MSERISVIIPVLHEEKNINEAITNVRSVEGGKEAEVIVVDADSKGSTIKRIRGSRTKKSVSAPGRGVQMNRGASVSTGSILLFLHADTRLPNDALMRILQTLEHDCISGGAFKLDFDRISPLIRAFLFVQHARGALTRVPYGDQAIFIRKEVFDELGGYEPIPLFEDVDLMKRMRKRGYRIRILKERVITSGRRFNEKGTLRTLAGNILLISKYHLGVDPWVLYRRYYKN